MAVVLVSWSLSEMRRSYLYASKFAAEASALDDLLTDIAASAPSQPHIVLVADTESDYEIAISFVEHLQFHGVTSTPIFLLPWQDEYDGHAKGMLTAELLQNPMFRNHIVGTDFADESTGLAVLVQARAAAPRFARAGWKIKSYNRWYLETISAASILRGVLPRVTWGKASWHLAEKTGQSAEVRPRSGL
jgi:hypothetical protein